MVGGAAVSPPPPRPQHTPFHLQIQTATKKPQARTPNPPPTSHLPRYPPRDRRAPRRAGGANSTSTSFADAASNDDQRSPIDVGDTMGSGSVGGIHMYGYGCEYGS